MRKRIIAFAAALLVLGGCYLAAHQYRRSRGRGKQAAQRTPAAEFSLPDLNGGAIDLASYKGKVVVLDFWATWCEPCREEIPRFTELQSEYGGRGLQIIGVSMDDTPDPVRELLHRFQMNYPVVLGNAEVGESYGGVLGLPVVFLLDRQGRINAKYAGTVDMGALEKDIRDLL